MYSNLELADAFIKAGELEDALEALHQQLKDSPQDDESRRICADVLARLTGNDNLRSAIKLLDELSEQTADDYIKRSVLLERLGLDDDAIAAVKQGYTKYPDDERLTERYLYLLRNIGKISEALEIVNKLLADQADDWRWLQWASDLSVDDGDHDAAIKHYSAALDAVKSTHDVDIDATLLRAIRAIYARILLARADVFVKVNQLENAETDYNYAAGFMPDEPAIPFNLGTIAVLRGDIDKAVELCGGALQKATPTMQEHMRDSLKGNAAYSALLEQLTKS
jgi:tetratricopeptide (TPR) repeat protein